MKMMFRVPLMPLLSLMRLMLACTAFVISVCSSLLGLLIGVFSILSVLQFVIGWWWNGVTFGALALLVSPIGLPLIADILLRAVDGILGFAERLVA